MSGTAQTRWGGFSAAVSNCCLPRALPPPGAYLPVRPVLRGDPLDAVVSILAAAPLAALNALHRVLRRVKAAPVDHDVGVVLAVEQAERVGHGAAADLSAFAATRRDRRAETFFVVRRLDQDGREFPPLRRQIDIRRERLAVAHRNADILELLLPIVLQGEEEEGRRDHRFTRLLHGAFNHRDTESQRNRNGRTRGILRQVACSVESRRAASGGSI